MSFQHRTLPVLVPLKAASHGNSIGESIQSLALSAQQHESPAILAQHLAAPAPVWVSVTGFYANGFKRFGDIVFSLIALILVAPVIAVLGLALWLEGGNPFYTQLRLGQGGRQFRMFKLRTMVKGADKRLEACLAADPALRAEWDSTQKLRNDPRVTRIGWFIRKTSLDELPQLLNVLRGDMSIVGPRPMLPDQLPLYLSPHAYLALRPGITGLWQVTARNDQAFDRRAIIDLSYFERLSFWLDLRIFLATFRAVVRGTGC